MATLEERVAFVEGQMAEQTHIFAAIREELRSTNQAIRDELKGLNQRIERVERQIDRLEDMMSRQFLWIVGIQITTLITVMAVVLSRG